MGARDGVPPAPKPLHRRMMSPISWELLIVRLLHDASRESPATLSVVTMSSTLLPSN